MAFFLSVSASFSTTFWVWAVIKRRVFSASLHSHTHKKKKHSCKYFFCLRGIMWTEWAGNRREFETHTETALESTDLQTYMSSKFLLIDSGIFGLVTRTAFIRMLKQCRGTRERKSSWAYTLHFTESGWLVIRLVTAIRSELEWKID